MDEVMMIYKTNILTMTQNQELIFEKDVYLEIENGLIKNIMKEFLGVFKDMSHCFVTPGFIDTHTHIVQHRIRGFYRPHLIDWLNDFTFKEEAKFESSAYAQQVTHDFFQEALSKGSTCIVGYMSIHNEACDIAFKNAAKTGIRAIIGKVMMDQNCPDFLKEDTDQSLSESIELYHKWNDYDNRLNYIFSPRFAPTCSKKMMLSVGQFINDHQAYMQTHLSENRNEIEWIEQLYPEFKSYTDIYYQTGLMTPKSIFGHCIHLAEDEMNLFNKTQSKIAYCPDSNFYLKSGEFNAKDCSEHNVPFAVASDIGAGTSLYMPYHAKMSIFRQSHYPLTPKDAFYAITLGAAKILGFDHKIGSIEVGKEADIVFFENPYQYINSAEEYLSKLVFTSMEANIKEVLVKGKLVYSRKS